MTDPWPPLPLSEWQDTCDTLHMWTQVVGKTRMALAPLVNHWWNVPLYVTPRGLTTSPVPYGNGIFEAEFDFIGHRLRLCNCDGGENDIALYPRSVADFYAEYMSRLHSLGIEVKFNTLPSEFPEPIRFQEDHKHASYDKDSVQRFHRILIGSDRVFQQFRSRFIGKSSPVHFFWGSFDLAVTRFSGKPSPQRPGVDSITREAYSHEVISCGFWPGDARFPQPAYYAYAAPSPAGLDKAPVRPPAAYWDTTLGEFLLKYDDARGAPSPDDAILDFCQSTYESAANLAAWDRTSLERA